MVDLQQFCSTEDRRPDLMKPFSRGEHTYATNGHICVRVARVADVPEGEAAIEKVFPKQISELSPARFVKLKAAPADTKTKCNKCNGTGTVVVAERGIIDVSLRGTTFDLKYINLIAALPGLMLPVKTDETEPMYFTFEGGDGLLMPRRRTCEAIEAEMSQSVDA